MPSSNPELNVRTDPVIEVARRGAVTLALIGGLVLAVASLVQVATGDETGVPTLLAALPTVAVALAMRRQDRPNVILLLGMISTFAVVSEVIAAWSGQTEFVAGIGSEVVVFGLGILAVFVARERPIAVAVGFLAAGLIPVVVSQIHLNGLSLEIVSDVVVSISVIGTVMYLVIRVLDSLSESQTRYSDLANVIPVAVYELDVTRAVERLARVEYDELPPGATRALAGELMRLVKLTYRNAMVDELALDYGGWLGFITGENAAAIRDKALEVFAAVGSGSTSGSGEASMRRIDGSTQAFIYRWSAGRRRGPTSPIRLVLAATDVSRLRETEVALERQLRERDQFVASVSHELRTPLTSIMGLTEELVARPEQFDAVEQADLLGIVAAETRDVVDIVEDLLVTARAEAGQLQVHPEPCDLSAEVTRIADLMGAEATADIQVWASADPGRLRQILRNLVSNARRHGGPSVRMSVSSNASTAYFEIRDDGDPLAESERERIFLPYERTVGKSVVESVGLGLHVARLLARLMDGDLTYSHDGSDTVFRLHLPLLPAAAVPGAEATGGVVPGC